MIKKILEKETSERRRSTKLRHRRVTDKFAGALPLVDPTSPPPKLIWGGGGRKKGVPPPPHVERGREKRGGWSGAHLAKKKEIDVLKQVWFLIKLLGASQASEPKNLLNCLPSSPLGNQVPFRYLNSNLALFSLPPRVFGCVASFSMITGPIHTSLLLQRGIYWPLTHPKRLPCEISWLVEIHYICQCHLF